MTNHIVILSLIQKADRAVCNDFFFLRIGLDLRCVYHHNMYPKINLRLLLINVIKGALLY